MRIVDRGAVPMGAVVLTALLSLTAAGEEPWHKTYAFDSHGIVSVTNVYGSVRIVGWDRAEVSAEVRRSSTGGAGSPDRVRIRVDEGKDKLGFRTEYPSAEESDVRVDFLLKVPRQAVVEFAGTIEGDIELSGLAGTVSAHALNGDVTASDLAGEAVLRAGNGNIQVSCKQLPDAGGLMRFESIRGHVVLVLPSGADADLSMETVTGTIETPYRTEVSATLEEPGVQARAGQGGIRIRVRTVRGDIRVAEASRIF